MKKNAPTDRNLWHTLTPNASCAALSSTEQGLNSQEAQQRLTQYGFNKLTSVGKQGVFKRFLGTSNNCFFKICVT